MRLRLLAASIVLLAVAGCLSGPDRSEGPGGVARSDPASLIPDHMVTGTLGHGAEVPLATAAMLRTYSHTLADVPIDDRAQTFTLHLESDDDVGIAFLRDAEGNLVCAARSGRTCSGVAPEGTGRQWALDVVSLTPDGGLFTAVVSQSVFPAAVKDDGLHAAALDVFRTEGSGGEPTLAWMDDGRLLVTPDAGVYRLELDGSYTDVTPILDATTGQTLDPFMVGDPTTGRIYVSQLAQCLRLSWTDDGGDSWATNPAVCAGPEQHHQKIAVGPGPLGRVVHVATMNLASWLTTDELVIVHSRSVDGGVTWTQNPAMVKQVAGMEARAVGNIAVLDDGTIAIIAYLCDRFVDAAYNGVAVGTSTDLGLTWEWRRIAPGGGRCEGIDPGIAAAGDTLYAAWEDLSDGIGNVWWSSSADGGATWTDRQALPTGNLGSFVFTDAAASEDRLAVAFLGTADTGIGPTQAPGWSQWHPYLATLDLTTTGAEWVVERLQEDPVQLGPICMDGPKCLDGARNLLDFIDVQLGADGRAAVAYADGCEADCDYSWQSRDSQLRVAREA
ncbi:MAG TPA: sialidase family protein [Candidatus Thermoplasmatota archaeon]|nr:sialidase family protein [Candidatus Thermoplasmatota archaeon]